MKLQEAEVVKVDVFKHLGSTKTTDSAQVAGEEESAGRVKWVETSVRGNLWQDSSKSEREAAVMYGL